MAMFPNATKGYMPYVNGKSAPGLVKNKRSKPHVNGGKLHHKSENRRHMLSGTQKIYQVTLKDKKGQTYKCIVKADGTKSLPELCESKLKLASTHLSMPNLGYSSPSKQRKILAEKLEAINSIPEDENFSTSLDLRNCGKKEGIFSAFIRIIKEKMGKSDKEDSRKHTKPHGKSKRKPRDLNQRKRQRTVSAMSNLDPIEESPNEHEYEAGDDDNDSYTHFSSSYSSDTDSSSVASSVSCTIEAVDAKGS